MWWRTASAPSPVAFLSLARAGRQSQREPTSRAAGIASSTRCRQTWPLPVVAVRLWWSRTIMWGCARCEYVWMVCCFAGLDGSRRRASRVAARMSEGTTVSR